MSIAWLEERRAELAVPLSERVRGSSAASHARVIVLEERGAELAGVLAVAAAGLVDVLAEAIVTDAWQGAGIRSVEHWATIRFGLSSSRAHRLATAAAKLADLPACREAFASGEITEDHVAAVVRADVSPLHDEQAADLARVGTVGQLQRGLSFLPPPPPEPVEGEALDRVAEEQSVPGHHQHDEEDGSAGATGRTEPGRREWLRTGHDDHGTWSIHGRLDTDRGGLIERALLAARDQLFRLRTGREPAPADLVEITGADALEHLARVALDVLDPATNGDGRRPSERFLVDLHLDAGHPHHGWLHLGPALPPSLAGLTSCDAEVRTWIRTAEGNVNLGRRQHTVDAKLRKVIEHRDGGCRIPGCDATRWLRIHHLHHWAHGGPTDSSNLVALCSPHHRLVHHGDLVLDGDADGALSITTADGRPFGPTAIRPPTHGLLDTITDAGLTEPGWENRSGEQAQWRWFSWHEPPSGN